jgi:hypothetical protein
MLLSISLELGLNPAQGIILGKETAFASILCTAILFRAIRCSFLTQGLGSSGSPLACYVNTGSLKDIYWPAEKMQGNFAL